MCLFIFKLCKSSIQHNAVWHYIMNTFWFENVHFKSIHCSCYRSSSAKPPSFSTFRWLSFCIWMWICGFERSLLFPAYGVGSKRCCIMKTVSRLWNVLMYAPKSSSANIFSFTCRLRITVNLGVMLYKNFRSFMFWLWLAGNQSFMHQHILKAALSGMAVFD